MIKKIAIVPFATAGKNAQVGHDGYLNIFRKKRSTVLKENLQAALAMKGQNVSVMIDVNHGDLQALQKEGADLFLLPEEIVSYLDFEGIDKKACFRLTQDEYNEGCIDRIVTHILAQNTGCE